MHIIFNVLIKTIENIRYNIHDNIDTYSLISTTILFLKSQCIN